MPEVRFGLEGVVGCATEIAAPDREGGALRYRGVDSSSSGPASASEYGCSS